MPYSLDCSYIDTCLSCYLQDHHNREGELLLGVPVDRSTRHWHLKVGLWGEFNLHCCFRDDFPEEITDEQVKAAIAECFADAHPLASFDSSLDRADDSGESCYAWFLLTWEKAE